MNRIRSRNEVGDGQLSRDGEASMSDEVQACAVIQSPGMRADGAYREDEQEPERPTCAGENPKLDGNS